MTKSKKYSREELINIIMDAYRNNVIDLTDLLDYWLPKWEDRLNEDIRTEINTALYDELVKFANEYLGEDIDVIADHALAQKKKYEIIWVDKMYARTVVEASSKVEARQIVLTGGQGDYKVEEIETTKDWTIEEINEIKDNGGNNE